MPSKQASASVIPYTPAARSEPKSVSYFAGIMPWHLLFHDIVFCVWRALHLPFSVHGAQHYRNQPFCSIGKISRTHVIPAKACRTNSKHHERQAADQACHNKLLECKKKEEKKKLTMNRSSSMTRSASLDIPRKKSLDAETLFCASWNFRTCNHTKKII